MPMAFRTVASSSQNLESRVRRACRDAFHTHRLLQPIVPGIHFPLGQRVEMWKGPMNDLEVDQALPGGLWDPEVGEVEGGANRAGDGDSDGAS